MDSKAFQTHYLGVGKVCSEVGSRRNGVCVAWVVRSCILGFVSSLWFGGILVSECSLAV